MLSDEELIEWRKIMNIGDADTTHVNNKIVLKFLDHIDAQAAKIRELEQVIDDCRVISERVGWDRSARDATDHILRITRESIAKSEAEKEKSK